MNHKYKVAFLNHLVLAALLAIAATAVAEAQGGSSSQQIEADPEDYFLAEDLELSTGEIVPAGTEWYRVPDVERLRDELADGTYAGDVPWGISVMFGFDIMTQTYTTIGEARTDGLPPVAIGQTMNCSSCHAQGGTVPYAWPFFRTITHFGLGENEVEGSYWSNLGYHRNARTRTRDCGRHCGGVVNFAEESIEMDGMVDWMIALRDGIYDGEGLLIEEFKDTADVDKIPGARIPLFANVWEMQADPDAGATIFKRKCGRCHAKDGEGKWNSKKGYAGHPPVAGDAAFTEAGGPLMIPVGAAFIHRQMPLSKPGSLTEQEALDVMGYIATLPRARRWWQDYYFKHDPCARPAFLPLYVGTVPVGFPYTADQAQFGPWGEVRDWLASEACTDHNPVVEPELGRYFDPGHTDNWEEW